MIKKIIKYYPELIVFGAIFAILLIDLNPDFTFMNKAADSLGYIYSAKYLYPSYHTSAPLYLLLSHVFLMIPLGTEAWRMGLISVFSTMGACVFLYLIIRHFTQNRLLQVLGVLLYGTSALVISQSTIVNTYSFITMFAIGAYYFAIKKHWKLTSVMLGLGLAVHLLGFIVWFLFFIFRDYRKNWKAILITISFILFYLYIPITSRPPYMWLPNPANVNTFQAVIGDTISVIAMLVGTISIWDLPKKILDTIGMLGISLAVISILPLVYYIKVEGKKILINPLFWLAFVPVVLFIGELDMNTFDYTLVGLPFLIIMAIIGIKYISERYKVRGRNLTYATFAIVIGLGIFNANYFDLGRTLDPNMSASNLYREQFPKIPDGAIFMPNGGWNWEAIFLYNRENNKNIYPICIDILPSETYREQLQKDGIKLEWSNNENLSLAASETAKSIVELNPNVYTTISSDPYTFGVEVVPANSNIDLINTVDTAIIAKNATNPDWHWIPDNPYKIMDTSLFITSWNYVVMSQYNFRLFFIVFLVIYAIMIFASGKKGKKDVSKNVAIQEKAQDTTR